MNDRAYVGTSAGVLMRTDPRSWRVSASQDVNYEVRQLDGLLDSSNRAFLDACGGSEAVTRHIVVIDERVDALYGTQIRRYYDHHGIDLRALVLPISEETKEMDAAMAIVRHLEAEGVLRRSDPLIGIGGGVLLLINFIGGFWGFRLGVNPITALVVGLLGVPGVLLLIALRLLFP